MSKLSDVAYFKYSILISFSPSFFFLYDSKVTLRIIFNPELRQKKKKERKKTFHLYTFSVFTLSSLIILLLRFFIQDTVVFTETEKERESRKEPILAMDIPRCNIYSVTHLQRGSATGKRWKDVE